ncbi:hypothetical protein L3Y34_006271 [Caenorhabditis briggsae]|uniref:Uncharacterized protein n=1 Tax=Caenorhabditis briggsae TaxID=6238 RepID=A0AAE8ZWI9_CAEBR|nr:hypothetical protein L3Y34_006271 [Caenorhabditis briggsae]
MLQVPDQDQARQMVLIKLPCIPDFLYSTEIIVPSLNNDIIVFTALVFILVVFGQLLTFTIVIIVQLSSNFGANLLSESTRRLQKNLLKALIWQTGIPLIYLVLPASLSMLTIPLGIYSRPFNNIIVAVTSLHGLVSTLSMILIHKPYRSTVAKCWKKKGTGENSRLVNNFPLFSTNTAFSHQPTTSSFDIIRIALTLKNSGSRGIMLNQLLLITLLAPIVTFAAEGSVYAAGQLLCDETPYAYQPVRIYEKNYVLADELWMETLTDKNGNFSMKVSGTDLISLTPYVYIPIFCKTVLSLGRRCSRSAMQLNIPSEYVSETHFADKMFDIGVVDLDDNYYTERSGLGWITLGMFTPTVECRDY